ncbi:two pore domain potassium channel family protein [Ancylobacter oerskovii]|uniref:Two pore domain potassium channel family protein n=1 Tax=Ancylobacter oerskovii TaxID=459519 RepID=A0ABW4YS86_9HYPH|nr:two pore domain potassium channel family protein [Ancylobacter oerskovii]MBS7545274.1 two pore domain potassium channel family protein [Ancylobacter oerskovii]
MISDLFLGLAVSLVAMLIHLAGTQLLVALMNPFHHVMRGRGHLRLAVALVTTYLVMLAAHVLEVGLWGLLFDTLGLAPVSEDAYYSAFVNYTTLGYGGSQRIVETRLLGPLASANGILMFGWSTALLVLVVQRHLPAHLTSRD